MNNESDNSKKEPSYISEIKEQAKMEAKTLAALHKKLLDFYLNQIAIHNELDYLKETDEEENYWE